MTFNAINGVDRQRLFGTIEAVKGDPALGRFRFRLSNEWIDGGENRSRIDGFYGAGEERLHREPFTLVNDEPDVLLSGDKAPNPVEYVLHALAGCLTSTLVYHAAARGIEIKGVRSRFEGEADLRGFLGIAKEVRPGFETIRVVFDIDADCDAKQKQALIEVAQAHSPVFDIVSKGVPVACSLAGSDGHAMAA